MADAIPHNHVPLSGTGGSLLPLEGEDYELLPRTPETPAGADFCILMQGDSMEPWIPDGGIVYVRRNLPLREFDAGVFFVDGEVICRQWCMDFQDTVYLLSANPDRRDEALVIPRDSGRICVCLGKVLLPGQLPLYD